MVLDVLQSYIETKLALCIKKNVDLRTVKTENAAASSKKIPQIFVLHADSCRKHVYPSSADWVCGGQWNEMLGCLEKFVRSFRQSNTELVVFFDGSVSPFRIHEWKSRQTNQRENVKQLMSKVVTHRAIPSRNLAVTPACFNTALRLALKSCNVIVCSSLAEVNSDITNYYRAQSCSGIIANSSYYLLQGVTNCFSPDHLKLSRYNARSSCVDFDAVLKELCLPVEALPAFASLIGLVLISEEYLANFHWTFLTPDHPLKKAELKNNPTYQNLLPPNDIIIKGVADFLQNKDLTDISSLAAEAFKDSSYDLPEATKKLKESIDYFKYANQISLNSADIVPDSPRDVNQYGFPVHNFGNSASDTKQSAANPKTNENNYQKRWQQFQKVQMNTQPPVQSKSDAESVDVAENEEKTEKKTHETASTEQIQEEEKQGKTDEPTVNGVEQIQDLESHEGATTDNATSKEEQEPSTKVYENQYENIKPILPTIPDEVFSIARKRHQSGEMTPEILQILTKGEILIETGIDEEYATMRPPIPLLYRPIRQLIYGILYDQKIHEEHKGSSLDENKPIEEDYRFVKEYCVYKGNTLDNPDIVEAKSIQWDIPAVKNLWLGRQPEDNTTRMKAFLTCMKSDTPNIPNTTMVPQHLLLLCCVLRYLIQQENSKPIIKRQDIDAFLAQALSSHMTTEANSMNLANLRLNQIDVSAMQLGSIFMSGIETAIIANDACGSPVPWEFCCPWIFFDGKLFHSKWLQASLNVATLDLCDGKPQLAEKLERLRWCITEGLEDKFKISGLKPSAFSGSPFGPTPPSHTPAPAYGINNYRPAGASPINPYLRNKGRGASSKRPVLGTGGTLEVAGVPVAHWSGNKSGIGYDGQSNDVIVGGRTSVDLPSEQRYGRRGSGRGRIANRGMGLLPTPLFSPWHVDYDGMRGVQNPFGRGPPNQMPPGGQHIGRPRARSLYKPTLSGGNRRPDYSNQANKGRNATKVLSKQSDMWLGRGRGITIDDGFGRIPHDEKPSNYSHHRGGWIQ